MEVKGESGLHPPEAGSVCPGNPSEPGQQQTAPGHVLATGLTPTV